MRRRVILLGGKTYVLSLPSQWVKKYRIQKGEELELEEKQNSILIKTSKHKVVKDLEIDFRSLDKMIGRAVGALYKAGYSKIKVFYNGKEQLQKIENTLHRTCVGFEITKEEEDYVVIENITEIKPEEFENSLKRLFFSLETSGNDLVNAKSDNDFKRIIEKDAQINRLADFCRRVINSGEVVFIEKPSVDYYLVEQLERIGDLYKKIADDCLNKKVLLSGEFRSSLVEINKLFISYRNLFYDFKIEDFETFGKSVNSLRSKLENYKKSCGVIYLGYLLDTIFDMNGALITRSL